MINLPYTTEEKRQLYNLGLELQTQWITEIVRELKKLAKKQTKKDMTKIQTVYVALTSPEKWQICLTQQEWIDACGSHTNNP